MPVARAAPFTTKSTLRASSVSWAPRRYAFADVAGAGAGRRSRRPRERGKKARHGVKGLVYTWDAPRRAERANRGRPMLAGESSDPKRARVGNGAPWVIRTPDLQIRSL